VIFGLVFATFLTLVVVPIMYLGVERMIAWVLDDGVHSDKTETPCEPEEPNAHVGIPELSIE